MVLTTRAGYIFMKETLFKNSADSKESRKKRRMNPSPPLLCQKKKGREVKELAKTMVIPID